MNKGRATRVKETKEPESCWGTMRKALFSNRRYKPKKPPKSKLTPIGMRKKIKTTVTAKQIVITIPVLIWILLLLSFQLGLLIQDHRESFQEEDKVAKPKSASLADK
jgi:hypothetical protein